MVGDGPDAASQEPSQIGKKERFAKSALDEHGPSHGDTKREQDATWPQDEKMVR